MEVSRSRVTAVEQCDTVLVLGAGFSFDAGIPLMSGFVDTMWEFAHRKRAAGAPLSSSDATLFDEAEAVRRDLNEYHGRASFDDRNIEDILSLLTFGTFDAQKKRRAAADLKVMSQAIARTIELCCSVKHPGLKQREKAVVHVGPELYRNFWHCLFGLKARGLSCPAIVTFNYDLVLERALLQTLVGTEYDNHKNLFPYSYVHLDHHYSLVPRRTFKVQAANFHNHGRADSSDGIVADLFDGDTSPASTLKIDLLKLHGSLNFPTSRLDKPEGWNVTPQEKIF